MDLRFRGKRVRQQFTHKLKIIPIGAHGERLPAKELTVVGEIVPDVIAVPREIHHGRQFIGSEVGESFRLTSLTKRQFDVKQIASSNKDFEATRIPGDDACRFSLKSKITETGERESELTFRILDQDGSEYWTCVPVRYFGVKKE